MKPQPLICVADVAASRGWYADVLGLESQHGGDAYERLTADGILVLQLHAWDAHDHPLLGEAALPSRGNGVALWFQTNQFDQLLADVTKSEAEVVDGPMVNQNANHREIWLRDPDGYLVVVAGAAGDLGA